MDLLLTLQDIADVAGVRRPVVSAWRSRPVVDGESVPFPQAVTSQGQVEYFDTEAVSAWIQRTGRGNNPQFGLDARAAAIPPQASFDELTALLALAVASDANLAGRPGDELLDLADAADPNDEFLFSEVEAIGPTDHDLTCYIDQLRALSFGPADAYERLSRSRIGRNQFEAAFSHTAVTLFSAVTAAIAPQGFGAGQPMLVDASAGGSRISIDIAANLTESAPVTLSYDAVQPMSAISASAIGPSDGEPGARVSGAAAKGADSGIAGECNLNEAALRAHKRVALLRGVHVWTEPTREAGPVLALLSVQGMPPAKAIEAIDELQLSLETGSVAIVVGASSLLCDAVDDWEAEAGRDAIVRTGTLRLAARLPRGLWPAAPRQALGMWVFGAQTARKIEDRTVALADLSQHNIDEVSAQDLASDVVGALGDVSGRAFRFCRLARTSRLVAARELVPHGASGMSAPGPQTAARIVQIESLVSAVNSPLDDVEMMVAAKDASQHLSRPARLSLRTLIDAGELTLIAGARLNTELARSNGTVAVFDPLTTDQPLAFDPLELQLHHPRAARTEPGDVVFTHIPDPAARVDAIGGCVVAYPARILRPDPGGRIGPHILARAINRVPAGAREWRSWHVPVAEQADTAELDSTLDVLSRRQAELQMRMQACLELADELTDAVAAHAISLRSTDPSVTEGN